MENQKEIPSGWTLVKLKDVAKWTSGGTPRSTVSEYYGGRIPWLIIGDLTDGFVYNAANSITELGLRESSAKIVKEESVLIAMYGSIGKLGINKIQVATNQAIAFTEELYGLVTNKYLFWYLFFIRPQLHGVGQGGTQKNISLTILKGIDIFIPTFPEQHRIVAKIEELFSELDKGVESLKTAQQQLKVYRQAVLRWAFEGKLTGDNLLQNCTLGEMVEEPRYGTSKRCTPERKGTAVLRIPNIINGFIDKSDLKYAEFDQRENDALRIKAGDILIIRSNGSVSIVGKAAVVRETDTDCLFAGYLIRLRPFRDRMNSYYLLHYLSSPEGRKYIELKAKSTSGVNNINSDEIKGLVIPWFSIEKQDAIVSEIESRLSICDKMEETIEHSMAQAEALRQSILKKAFEGKLVPQDSNDEPADRLLERIRAEREANQPPQKTVKGRTKK